MDTKEKIARAEHEPHGPHDKASYEMVIGAVLKSAHAPGEAVMVRVPRCAGARRDVAPRDA